MRSPSIRARLALWHTAVVAIALIFCGVTLWLMVRHFLYNDLTRTVLGQSAGLSTYLTLEARDTTDLSGEIDEYARSLSTPELLAVYTSGGQIIYSNSPGLSLPDTAQDEASRFLWKGSPHLAVSHLLRLPGRTFVTFVAVPVWPIEHVLRLLAIVLFATIPAFILAGALGGLWLSRHALRPIDALTATARATGLTNLSERLPLPSTDDELERLTVAWNEMLERLENAVQGLRQFTADASHELRTPVAIVRLTAENALNRDRSPEQYREALHRIQRQSENMTALLGNLLFLARTDTTNSAMPSEIVELNDLVRSVLAEFKSLADEKHLALRVQCSEPSPMVSASRSQLSRLTSILLDNAIKYTPAAGSVQLTTEESEGRAILRVADTGPGVPPDLRERIFDRFFRLDPSRSKDSGGFGLGLSIAAAIAKEHLATIEVTATAGGGSVFTLSLPSVRAT